jgi:hypothetical protein
MNRDCGSKNPDQGQQRQKSGTERKFKDSRLLLIQFLVWTFQAISKSKKYNFRFIKKKQTKKESLPGIGYYIDRIY